MKIVNQFKMTLLSKSANEGFARVAVAGFLAQLDPTLEEISDIKTAVSEAVTNCIVHGYKEEIGNIYITVSIYDTAKITITIKDKGCGIPDIEQAMQPMFTTDTGGERAGLGFAIMSTFMDSVKVRSALNKGTTVRFSKTLKSRADKNEEK